MNHGQSKAGSHSGIHGVSASMQNLHAGIGSKMMHADHHPMRGANRLLV
jgi:hypothetical protein